MRCADKAGTNTQRWWINRAAYGKMMEICNCKVNKCSSKCLPDGCAGAACCAGANCNGAAEKLGAGAELNDGALYVDALELDEEELL